MSNTSKKKIYFIHHGAVPGGAPTSLRNLVQGIARSSEFSCSILCVWPEMMPFFSSLDNVKVGLYPKTGLLSGRVFMGWSKGFSIRKYLNLFLELCKSPFYILREIRFFHEHKPDIIHLNSSILWMSAIAARACRVPLVWHIREASDDTRFNLIRIIYTWFVRFVSAKVICIGPQEYKKIGGKYSRKVEIIYNSLSESYFVHHEYSIKDLRKELGLPQNAFLFLSLGGLSFRKGTYQFIEAVNFLPHEYCGVLAGAKPTITSDSSFEKLIKIQLAVEDFLVSRGIKSYYSWHYAKRVSASLKAAENSRIFTVGIVDDVQPYIKACDVVIFCGTTPHSARPVYEAWALKKPVIAFDTEVMRQDINDGVDGILIAEHSAEKLAEAIMQMHSDSLLAQHMGRAGYTKAVERFSMRENNDKILSIYRKLASENSI